MKTFAGDMQHLLRKEWERHHTMSSIDHDVWMAFVGTEFCDGPGLASNDIMAARSASSADKPSSSRRQASAGVTPIA